MNEFTDSLTINFLINFSIIFSLYIWIDGLVMKYIKYICLHFYVYIINLSLFVVSMQTALF